MRVAVVGDLIVDEYYEVDVDRISPEYPIPVYSMASDQPTRVFMGGAAGVAQQIAKFGHLVDLYTRCEGLEVAELETTKCLGIRVFDCYHKPPVKKRYYSDGIPLTRIDVEDTTPIIEEWEDDLIEELRSRSYDIVVFSDYHKGFFVNTHKWISAARDAYTIVDSKKSPEKWDSCHCYKPNSHAAIEITGETNIEAAAAELQRRYSFEIVVVTDGGSGVVAATNHGVRTFPGTTVENPFVVGAGDSFAAGLAVYLCERGARTIFDAASMQFEDTFRVDEWVIDKSMKLSSKFVELGRTVHPIDLLEKVVVCDLEVLSRRDFSLVFTNGCFDILHPGHIKLLKYAKDRGDKLLVAVNSDASIKRLKGDQRPVIPESTRVELLAALPYVDYVCVFDEDTPIKLIEDCQPDLIVKGGDYAPDKVVGSDIAPVVTIARDDEWSTTNIIRRSAVAKFFAKLLGRP